jgi:AcrR family transcriptional regulator
MLRRQVLLVKRLKSKAPCLPAMNAPLPLQASESPSATYDRVIDAAEVLFAEYGYNGVSIRRIARAASSNLASISYHFGDKAGLLRAIFERRVKPISAERIRMLEASQPAAKGGAIDLEALVRGFIAPSVRLIRGDVGAQNFRRLAGRASTDPTPEVRNTIHEVYDAVALRYVEALRKVCKTLPEQEFYWRLNFVYGVMLYTNADTGRVQQLVGDRFDASDPETGIDCMVRFLTAGLAAPPVLGARPAKRKPVRQRASKTVRRSGRG